MAVGDTQTSVKQFGLATRQVRNRMEQIVPFDLSVIPAGVAITERETLTTHLVSTGNGGAGGLAHTAQPVLVQAPVALGTAEDAHVTGIAVHQNQPTGVAAELLSLVNHALLCRGDSNGLGFSATV